jgi:hypothetical protein
MTAEELIAEGRALQRPVVLLTEDGEGEPVAKWYGIEEDDEQCWLTVAARSIPNAPSTLDNYLTLYTSENSAKTGRIEVTPRWPDRDGIALYAQSENILPPINAVFLRGSSAVEEWLKTNRWQRTWAYNDNFPDTAMVKAYEGVWFDEFPLYRDGVAAALGGWHMPWPDGDWLEYVDKQLLIFTVRDSEPWVEVWFERGQLYVRQRRT